MKRILDVKMRDPFIFYHEDDETYYIYGTTFADSVGIVEPSFSVIATKDFTNFDMPQICFAPPKGFWGVRNYWAPEVYKIGGKFYMLASFKGGIKVSRGCSFLVADHPRGPFYPHSTDLTTEDLECLDATYFNDGVTSYITYCEEWTQLYYGRIVTRKISNDLQHVDKDKVTIIDTENIDFISKFRDKRNCTEGYLTDAPFFHRTKTGRLFMLWSSYSKNERRYCVLKVEFLDGIINCNFRIFDEYLLNEDVGHPSIFVDKNNVSWLVAHNDDRNHGNEKVILIEVDDTDDLKIKENYL